MTSWSTQQKTLSNNTDILLESGFSLLLENGGSLLTEEQPGGPQFTNQVKNNTSWITEGQISYILDEDGNYILDEDGNRILLEQSDGHADSVWVNDQRS